MQSQSLQHVSGPEEICIKQGLSESFQRNGWTGGVGDFSHSLLQDCSRNQFVSGCNEGQPLVDALLSICQNANFTFMDLLRDYDNLTGVVWLISKRRNGNLTGAGLSQLLTGGKSGKSSKGLVGKFCTRMLYCDLNADRYWWLGMGQYYFLDLKLKQEL